jgi:hypothetical protein
MLDSVIDMKDGAVELAKVDIDNNAELAMEYGVCFFLDIHLNFKVKNLVVSQLPYTLKLNGQINKHRGINMQQINVNIAISARVH